MIDATKPVPPIPTTTSSVGPVPTVVPGKLIFQEVHDAGERTLLVVTVLMGLSSLVFFALAARVTLPKRVIHTLVSITTTVSFIVYLALATGEGIVWKSHSITERHKHVPNTHHVIYRQVFWLRYVNWFLTSPLILTSLALLSGLPGANLVVGIVAEWVMLSSGLLGTFASHTGRRWVWFVISCLGYLTVVYEMGFHGQKAARTKDNQTKRFYALIAMLTLLFKAVYPVVLAAGVLDFKITLDAETILYAILDIFVQGILGYWLLIIHDSSSEINVYLDGFWAHGFGNEGVIRIEETDGA